MGMMPGDIGSNQLSIVYDGECPFCANFVKLYSISKKVSGIELINARQRPALVRDFRSKGMEINEGMIVTWRGHHYFGAEAMNLLAILGNDSGLIGMLNRLLFRNRTIAAVAYPLLAAGRRMALALLRRKLIPLEIPSPPPPLPFMSEGKSRCPDGSHNADQPPLPFREKETK
jgi:predicted DCC family thiol-disulfide oxidoreductase YuxK